MSENQHRTLSVIWPGVDEVPVQRANYFLSQLGPGPDGMGPEEILLSLGYLAPPVLLGTPEEQSAAVNALGAVAVRPLARVSISRGRLGELIGILQQAAAQYDGAQGAQG